METPGTFDFYLVGRGHLVLSKNYCYYHDHLKKNRIEKEEPSY
jgi:hypothetical protein